VALPIWRRPTVRLVDGDHYIEAPPDVAKTSYYVWRMSRSETLLLFILCASVPTTLFAQADSGRFVVRHAGDTVAVETFARSASKLEGTLALRNSKKTSEHYSAAIAADGTLPLIEITVREGADTGATRGKVVQRARVIFKEDSAAVDEVGNTGLVTRVFGTSVGAVPYLNLSFALMEQAVRRARRSGGESQVSFFNLAGGQTLPAKVSALGSDSVAVEIGNIQFHLRLDREGRVLGGRIPSQDVVAERL
jgi:hypothetical protein